MRPAWRAHVGIAFALGLFGSGLAVLIVVGHPIGAATVPDCEAVTPTAPDFEVAPFDFDPAARADVDLQAWHKGCHGESNAAFRSN